MNIYQRMHAVMAELKYIQKTGKVSGGGANYRFVGHDAVSAVVHEHLVANGIYCRPVFEWAEPHVVEMKTKNGIVSEQCARTLCTLHFHNIEKPEEVAVCGPFEGMGFDRSDKASGKAASYAFKMGLLKSFMLESGERDNEEDDNTDPARAPAQKASEAEVRIGTFLNLLETNVKAAEAMLENDPEEDILKYNLEKIEEFLPEIAKAKEFARANDLNPKGELGQKFTGLEARFHAAWVASGGK